MKRLICFLLGGHRWYFFHRRWLPGGIGTDPIGVCVACGARRE